MSQPPLFKLCFCIAWVIDIPDGPVNRVNHLCWVVTGEVTSKPKVGIILEKSCAAVAKETPLHSAQNRRQNPYSNEENYLKPASERLNDQDRARQGNDDLLRKP